MQRQQNCQEVAEENRLILHDSLQDLIQNEPNTELLPILSFLSNLLTNGSIIQHTVNESNNAYIFRYMQGCSIKGLVQIQIY